MGPTFTRPVQDPLAVVLLDNQLFMKLKKHFDLHQMKKSLNIFSYPDGSQGSGPSSLIAGTASHISEQMHRLCLDPDFSPDEAEEKARLISQVGKSTFRHAF